MRRKGRVERIVVPNKVMDKSGATGGADKGVTIWYKKAVSSRARELRANGHVMTRRKRA
jgi:hypothetical protein